MQILFDCPNDGCVALIEYEPLEDCTDPITCPRCSTQHTLQVTQAMRDEQLTDRCAVCGCTELFIRRDFPQRLGLAIVVVFGLTAIYFFRTSVLIGWSVLAAALLIDLGIYLLTGVVTTCYACRAQYRKCRLNSEHEGFELATSEKY